MNEPRIVTAFAEPAHGPGWANTPVWVVVHDDNSKVTVECFQPKQQTNTMRALYAISAAVHAAMVVEAKKVLAKRKAVKA